MRFVVVAAMLLAGSAHADVIVAWRALEGFYVFGPGTGFLSPSGSATAQLLWLGPDDMASPPQADGTPNDDDVVLSTETISFPGNSVSAYGDGWTFNYQGAYPMDGGSMAVIRVFQDTSPAMGEVYYDGPAVSIADLNMPMAPQVVDANLSPMTLDGDQLTQPVPVSLQSFGVE